MYNFLMMISSAPIPFWVWLVVGVEIVGVAVATFFLLRKGKRSKETVTASPAQEKALDQAKKSVQEQKTQKTVADTTVTAQATVQPQKPVSKPVSEKPQQVARQEAAATTPASVAKPTPAPVAKSTPAATPAPAPAATPALTPVVTPAPAATSASTPVVQYDDGSANQDNLKVDRKDCTYHVSKRFIDDKWQIKLNDSTRAMRIFDTQAEALQYATDLAQKKNGNVVVHKRSERNQ